MKVALVYDRVNKIGGAEKILESLHHIWPEAPLYTSLYSPKKARWADGMRVITSFLQKIPFAKNHHEWFFWAMPIAFETFDFTGFDVVISISSAEAKGIITKPATLHIHYCLTPTKYLYSQSHLHLKHNPLGRLGSLVLKSLWKYQKRWDQIASKRPDIQIAISKTVDDRCVEYYGRRSEKIIYPPVDYTHFKQKRERPIAEEYYVLVSRLVPSKRVDLAVKAFNALGEKLIIIGEGVMLKSLKKLAKKNITFLGLVDPETLTQYYQHSQAFIFPSEEDFGIVMVESLASGKPVIAFEKGGASEIIDSGKHGLLFDAQKVSSIMKSVQDCKKLLFSPLVLKKRAQRFSKKIFESEFEQFVRSSWQTYQKTI